MPCSIEKAKSIYRTTLDEGIAENLILQLEGLNESEYKQALKLYLKTLLETDHTFDTEYDNEVYKEFQQANYDEYFDWALTYRFCLYK